MGTPKPKNLGGARRDRTADLLHAMQALSQLSYSPKRGAGRYVSNGIKSRNPSRDKTPEHPLFSEDFQGLIDRGRNRPARHDHP